jgi:translation initiation factor IF-3
MSATHKINNQITAPEVRVIGEAEENIGVLKLSEALKMAKDKGLDLIEISSATTPPVCRIISYDKFRYQQEKKLKKQRSNQRGGEQKQVQISIREAKNDLEMKVGRVHEFLAEGHQVEVYLSMRGRELGNRDFAKKKIQEFMTMITVPYQVLNPIGFGGRGFTTLIAKK